MKTYNKILIAIVILMFTMVSTVDAAFGGRSSSSSSSSKSSSSRSYSSKSYSSKPSSSRSFGGRSSSNSYSGKSYSSKKSSSALSFGNKPTNRKVTKPAPIKITRDNVMTALNSGKGAKGDAAGVLYKNFQRRNTKPLNNGKLNTSDINKAFSPSYRKYRKAQYYGEYQPTPSTHYRESVHVNHSNGYGMWDYLMFDSILDNVGDRQMYYHHQNDQAFKDWRTDANAACAAGDKAVCEKLADLDKEMAVYKNKGVPINPSYLTPGIDPDIYEANNIDRSKLPEIKLCTGAVGSAYSTAATSLTKITKLKVTSIPTNGSADNMAKLATGECDLAFVQHDIAASPHLTTLFSLNRLEAAMLICPIESGINKISDLNDKHTILIGSDQTGSQFTFDMLKDNITTLSSVRVDESQATMMAVDTVKNSKDQCLFSVTTPNHQSIHELDNTGKFQMIPIPSIKGYTDVIIDVKNFDNLTQKQYIHQTGFMWLFKSGGTDSIGIKTNLITPQTWIDQNKQLFDLLLLKRNILQSTIK